MPIPPFPPYDFLKPYSKYKHIKCILSLGHDHVRYVSREEAYVVCRRCNKFFYFQTCSSFTDKRGLEQKGDLRLQSIEQIPNIEFTSEEEMTGDLHTNLY